MANASVLVVEDSSTMRRILCEMLSRLGFRHVDEAADGTTALAKLRTRSYSLVISDWHMEEVSGLDLLREVRRISTPGQNRFIFSTTEHSWGSQTSAKLEGAVAFIVKPFTIDMLRGKLLFALSS